MSTASVGRRIAVLLLVPAGAAVVALSWMVPEPSAGDTARERVPAHRIEPISYQRCVQQAPPSYGTRSLNNPVTPAC